MSSQLAFYLLLGAVGILRLVEVVVSKRHARGRDARVVAEPALFPLMVALHVGLIAAPALEVGVLARPFLPPLAACAGLTLLAATALRVWTLRTIGRAWNVRVVVPDEAQVVSSGPYAWIRHPNYLVVILEVAALPLLHTAWVSALGLSLLNGVVLWRRIHTEERALGQLAGWREAMAQRARLIPGVF
ncbi:MAG: hypothetical protein KDD82_29300 [Planctomycetes bacterium]|nr:hypothetical protein [Planctomycetota bacterium]